MDLLPQLRQKKPHLLERQIREEGASLLPEVSVSLALFSSQQLTGPSNQYFKNKPQADVVMIRLDNKSEGVWRKQQTSQLSAERALWLIDVANIRQHSDVQCGPSLSSVT